MKNEVNNQLLLLEAEKQQTELRLKEQIKSIRYTLDNLESKLEKNEKMYESDGLQGNANAIDIYVNKIAMLEKTISFLTNLNKEFSFL